MTPVISSSILSVLENLAALVNGDGERGGRRRVKIHVRTKEKCPKCGKSFRETPLGLICPACLTVPRRFFIDLSWKGRRIKVYSFKDGTPISSWDLAKKVAGHIEYEIRQGVFDPSLYVKSDVKRFLIENYLDKWLSYCETRLKPGSLKERRRIFTRYVLPFFKTTDIREIRASHILDFHNHLQGKKLAAKTVKNVLDELRALLRFAYKIGDIRTVPAFPEVKTVSPPIKWIDEETQLAILSHIPEQHRPIFIFLITYGCRPGEARALKWDCVDFRNETITIRRTFSKCQLAELPKENDWKVLPMLPHIKKMLKDLSKSRRSEFVFSHAKNPYYGDVRLGRLWREACKKVGVDIPLYAGVRHSFVMQRLEMGFTYEQIGACLGHKVLETTKRYGKLQAHRLTPVFAKVVPFEKALRDRRQEDES